MDPKSPSEPTMRRFPMYYHHLKALSKHHVTSVSCTTLGRELNLDPSQIRKDFESAGFQGRPRIGYAVDSLLEAIEHSLGWHQVRSVLLAGAGPLGRAILGFDELKEIGLRIVSVFDADEEYIGRPAGGFEVMPLGFLSDVARTCKAKVGIITLPAATAQTAADLMVRGGIRAIWNFEPTVLRVPEDVIVQNAELYSSLGVLSSKLARSDAQKGKSAAPLGI